MLIINEENERKKQHRNQIESSEQQLLSFRLFSLFHVNVDSTEKIVVKTRLIDLRQEFNKKKKNQMKIVSRKVQLKN